MFVRGFIFGTNAAADRIEVDAPATKETNMTKVARGANDEGLEARLLRAFCDWQLMGLCSSCFCTRSVKHLGCLLKSYAALLAATAG